MTPHHIFGSLSKNIIRFVFTFPTQLTNQMATPIREQCLDEHDQPNKHAIRIQFLLDAGKGCDVKKCGGKLTLDAFNAMVLCSTCPKHARPACLKKFNSTVGQGMREAESEERADYERASEIVKCTYGKRKAEEEAEMLGEVAPRQTEYNPRPDGRAPQN
jgi:hypothetical protein